MLEVIADGKLELTRPSCGDRIYVTMACHSKMSTIVTVRLGILGLGKPRKGRNAEISAVSVGLPAESIRTSSRGIRKVDRDKLDVQEAEVILAFGRGAEDEATVAQLLELARLLEAPLGGSRVAVDNRWITFERQIGQTGKTISPKVILCCGISGAQQFTMVAHVPQS